MNKYVELIKNSQIGTEFKDLRIEGLDVKSSCSVLQEIARHYNKQLYIEYIDGYAFYTLVKPSKKFINRIGVWSTPISDKAKEYLISLDL